MPGLLLRRAIRLVIVCLGISLITFSLMHLTGDPAAMLLPEAIEADRARLRAVLGDFGQSFFHKTPALPLVLERMPTTVTLTVLALALALVVAVPAGIYTAVRRNSMSDHVVTVTVFLGQSMPVFWTGIMLMLLFAVQWRLLPVSGWGDWRFWVLPAVTLGTFQMPLLTRIVRSSMLEVLGLEYMRTARAKGLREWGVICRHGLVNAALPVVTVTGLQFGILLGGAVITETVFAVPGVGRLIVRSIIQLDFPVVQAGVFMLAMIIVSVNFLVDLFYVYLNPQVRIQ
jgi:ABC-type dipeptide/oligopeptide/nickel transport system permease component